MYDPPKGYADLCGDAEVAPWPCGELWDVEVAGHRFEVYRPAPRVLADLAMVTSPDADAGTQQRHLHKVVEDHLADGTDGGRELLRGMVEGVYPDTVFGDLAEAIVTIGTARPFQAVLSLAGVAGFHWRAVRHKLLTSGIADPMALPGPHPILDVAEGLVVEGMSSHDDGQDRITRFYDALYRPARRPTDKPAGDGWKPPPSGFSAEDIAEVERLSRHDHGQEVP